jgi:hypothetical protein
MKENKENLLNPYDIVRDAAKGNDFIKIDLETLIQILTLFFHRYNNFSEEYKIIIPYIYYKCDEEDELKQNGLFPINLIINDLIQTCSKKD